MADYTPTGFGLVDIEQFRRRAHMKKPGSGGASVDVTSPNLTGAQLEIIDMASVEVEEDLLTDVFTRGSVTEYHNIREPITKIWSRCFPVISVQSLHEDLGRSYTGPGLVEDVEFVVSKSRGSFQRVSGSTPLEWQVGVRTVRLVYTYGYANLAAIPVKIRDVVLDLAVRKWREVVNALQNVTSISDETGNITRYAQAKLTDEMRARLTPHRRIVAGMPTVDRG